MRQLRVPYEVTPNPESTKSKILLASAKLFAVSGYAATSTKDIAKESGIMPASIYFHFTNKKEILDSMLERCERELYEFYALLDNLSYNANSLQEILNNIFIESQEITNPFSHYVIWCAMNTQFMFETSYRLYHDVFFADGHVAMRKQLEIAVERNLVLPFNTAEVASLITNAILAMIGFHVGALNGYYQEFDFADWYTRQINNILHIVKIQ